MPIYSMKCKKCGSVYDHFHRNIAKEISGVKCPECGSKRYDRNYGTGNFDFHLKGGGFYSTDYPSKKRQQDKIKYLSED